MSRFKRITIKVGSNVLTRSDGKLDVSRMSALVDQIAELHKQGVEIILVSSGAVASGKSEIHAKSKLDAISSRQLYSAVGQAKLINRYYDFFKEHGIACGQVLTTKESLGTRRHYLNQKNCMRVMLDNNVIPVMNENDTIAVTELMFTDNDELSGMIATMMDAEALILLSNIDGIYAGSPEDPGSEVIKIIHPDQQDLSEYIRTDTSSFGRGGMLTKYRIARKVANEGIEVIIANGKKENILMELLADDAVVCTRFLPSSKEISGVKKWISHSDSFAKGKIYVNAGAKIALLGAKASSLLPIGVIAVEGVFEKDDIVKIFDDSDNQLGLGRIGFNSEKVADMIGKKGKKPIIHYDYLYLEQNEE